MICWSVVEVSAVRAGGFRAWRARDGQEKSREAIEIAKDRDYFND